MRTIAPRASRLVALLGVLVLSACGSGVSPTAEPSSTSRSTAPSAERLPLLIDTDVAPDDLVAMAFLLGSPTVKIEAITVSGTGEAHCGPGVDVVLRLLERLKAPPIDVACGRETPIAGNHAFPDAWRERVDAGSGLELPATSRQPFEGSAVQLIADAAARVDGLRVLTLGPLTNLADALTSHPDLAGQLESVHSMGGALHVPGNVAFGGPADNQVAEWNIYADPTAAQMVIDSGVRVRLTGLDGTNQVPLTPEFAQRVRQDPTGPGSRLLTELFTARPAMTDGTYYLWDPLAAAVATHPSLGSFRPARVAVEVAEGPEVGFTRPVDGSPNVEYLDRIDPAAVEALLLRGLGSSPVVSD